jgi:hypothetical protein
MVFLFQTAFVGKQKSNTYEDNKSASLQECMDFVLKYQKAYLCDQKNVDKDGYKMQLTKLQRGLFETYNTKISAEIGANLGKSKHYDRQYLAPLVAREMGAFTKLKNGEYSGEMPCEGGPNFVRFRINQDNSVSVLGAAPNASLHEEIVREYTKEMEKAVERKSKSLGFTREQPPAPIEAKNKPAQNEIKIESKDTLMNDRKIQMKLADDSPVLRDISNDYYDGMDAMVVEKVNKALMDFGANAHANLYYYRGWALIHLAEEGEKGGYEQGKEDLKKFERMLRGEKIE